MKISPSICTGGYDNVAETLRWLEKQGVDRIHLDIMDGQYVPSIMGGTDYVRAIRRECNLPLELHFMCNHLEYFLEMYQIQKGDFICVHADSTYHPHRALQIIAAKGAYPILVLSVDDQPEEMIELYDQVSGILLMAVQTGCPAAEFHWSVLDKIRQVKALAAVQGLKLPIEIDGSVGPDNIVSLIQAGADAVVLGYPGCFDPNRGKEATLDLMRRLIHDAES